jgi:hypothetical protein
MALSRQPTLARRTAPARAEPPAPDTARPKPPVTLPKIELVSRTETALRPAPAATPPRPASAAPTTPASPASGGSVAGSYALQENAYALRDYYRSQNVRAGVERIMVNDRPTYQVRVWR